MIGLCFTSSGMNFSLYTRHIKLHFSKNSSSYFFREFIRELSRDLKQKPKQSMSNNSGRQRSGVFQTNSILSALGKKNKNTNSLQSQVQCQNNLVASQQNSMVSDGVKENIQNYLNHIFQFVGKYETHVSR